MIADIKTVVNHTCLLGEGPVWDAKTKTICWVDILNGEIHQFSTLTNQLRTIPVNDMVGAVALCTNGDLIAALKSGLAIINRTNGEIKMLHHPEVHLPDNRFNDGKCDPAGRFWIGTMEISEEPDCGSLYMIEKDLSYTKKIEGVSVSNGMAWSPDHSTFYYIDSPTRKVVAYNYDITTGAITNKRIAVNIPQTEGFPDGMTIDTEGMLWIGHWDGWQVARWDPFTGEKLLSISLPAARITSCTFGGDDLQDLYITSARVGLTEQQLAEQPVAGSLFVINSCGFRGMPAFEFDYQFKEMFK
jgi:sugar lactone lactonase YvrE